MAVNAFLPPFVGGIPLYGLYFFAGILFFLTWALCLAVPFRRPALIAIAGGVFGGYALTQWTLGSNQGFYAAALGAGIVLLPLAREGKWCWRRLGDMAVAPLAFVFALMKFGCLAGGCCLGGPHTGPFFAKYHTHWPVVPKVLAAHSHWEGIALFPAPLYVALISLGIGLMALSVRRPLARWPGAVLLLGVVAYSMGRVWIDAFAGTELAMQNMRMGLAFGGLMVGMWCYDSLSHRSGWSGLSPS